MNDPYYFNGGGGNDRIDAGTNDDFLVGGAGNDTLVGGDGDDSFIGGGGDDRILAGDGDDTAIFNVSTDGADSVALGDGSDLVNVNAAAAGQVRLTFTSSEVGNGSSLDSNTMTNQDGGLAVRLQAENGSDGLTGPVSRFDDEGITFVGGTGVTFDVRDLVSGVARGDQFEVVALGTSGNNTLTAVQADRPYYFNAGAGSDVVTGGTGNDFLVGGAGNDTLSAGDGNDSFIAGAGNDSVAGGGGADAFIFGTALDPASNVDTIAGFSHADDTIRLDDAVFAGLAPGALDPEAFALASAAAETDDRIIYDDVSGDLFFDADGGTRDDLVRFATLANSPNDVAADDFFVI